MKYLQKLLKGAALAALLSLSSASAATLAYWSFETPTESGTYLDPTTSESNITVSALSTDIDLSYGGTGQVAAYGNPTPDLRIRFDTIYGGGDTYYLEVTITAAEGYTFSLTSFSVDRGLSASGAGGVVALSSSVDGFAERINAQAFYNVVESATPAWDTTSFDLEGVEGMTDLTSITFRIIVVGSQNTSTRFLDLDNLTFTGSVTAIPESSSSSVLIGLAGLSALLFLRLRARRR